MRATSATGSNRGFTLIELTAVLMLVAIGFAALSYGLTAQLENQRVKAAARELVAALRQTRAQAILKGESQALELDLRERSYRVPGREPVSLPEGMGFECSPPAASRSIGSAGASAFTATAARPAATSG